MRNFQFLRALGRLAPGAEPAAVAAELDERYEDIDEQGVIPDEPFDAMSGLVLDINAQRNAKRQLQLFLAGSVLLALVAAANVSLFLLSRAPGRRHELGIRMSVGAPLRRLGRQLATEASLLIVAATALGLLAGFWLQSYLQGISFLEGARWQSASLLDWRVLAVIVSFLLLLTLLVSLAPVFGLKRLGIASSSRSVATRANLTQRIACSGQIAIAGTVAAAAIAFGWYLALLVTADHGYDTRDVHAVTMTQQPNFGPASGQDFTARFAERERRRQIIAGIPGIESVAFGTAAPGVTTGTLIARIPRPIPPGDNVQFAAVAAGPQYFEMLDIDLIDGSFYEGDEGNAMIVNEAAARLIWGRADVVGETLPLSIGGTGGSEMIGVVADIAHEHPDVEVPPRVYVPIMPFFGGEVVFVRSPSSSAEIRAATQSLIDSGDLDFTIRDVQRLSERVATFLAADRARSLLTIVSAIVVLVVAGSGFYGTQRFLVSAGRREYAIRSSIGAGPRALGRLVLGRGLVLSLPGLVLGGLLAFIVTAWLRDDFVSREVSPGVVTVSVVAALFALILAASLGPSRQARRTEPAPLLREE
ncbi:MAG TPA: FtsX-like permease family protein [Gammaproteobacteria bacterium]|nr:FtsX-like permease family protein [Gammaproteobacteria bacterium]